MQHHPVFEIVTTTTGVVSIRNKVVNEIMHNPVGPWIEANSLYIEQSQLKEQLAEVDREELVVFDVGLGAAANALAALHCAQQIGATQTPRKLKIISFERDLELLRFALANAHHFPHFSGFELAIESLLKEGLWTNSNVRWELRHGDFRTMISQEPSRAHVIFFDPYSPQVNQEMWSVSCFRELRQKCRDDLPSGATLYTYSQATPIRVALLLSGFFVGQGRSTGLKKQTTQAATLKKRLSEPLDERWLNRWKNSGAPFPLGSSQVDHAQLRLDLLNHCQFTDPS